MPFQKTTHRIKAEELEQRNCLSVAFLESSQEFGDIAARDVALADVDRDGDLDLFIATDEPASYQIWTNGGNGEFRDTGQRLQPDRISSTVRGNRIEMGDLDGDGDLDALTDSKIELTDGSLEAWLNDGSGTFSGGMRTRPILFGSAVADLDGDDDVDLFHVLHTLSPQRTEIWINDSNGMFTRSKQGSMKAGGTSVALADFDGDSDLDAFVGSAPDGQFVWLNDGSGTFMEKDQQVKRGFSWFVAAADLDGDRDVDVYLANDGGDQILLNDGHAQFQDTGQSLGGLEVTRHVELADFDADGDVDALTIAREFDLTLLLNNGSGVFHTLREFDQGLFGILAEQLSVGDLDNDGDNDVVTVESDGRMKLWLNTASDPIVGDSNHDGEFNQIDIIQVLQAAKYLTSEAVTFEEGDWNGDGIFDQLDIVAALQTGNYLQGARGGRLADSVIAALET